MLIDQPTVFKCCIPTNDIQDCTLKELVGLIAVAIVKELLGLTIFIDVDFGFYIRVPLAPNNILEVEHPTEILDPLTNRMVKL